MALPWLQHRSLPDSPTVSGFNQIRQHAADIRAANEKANDGRRPIDLLMAFAKEVAERGNPPSSEGGAAGDVSPMSESMDFGGTTAAGMVNQQETAGAPGVFSNTPPGYFQQAAPPPAAAETPAAPSAPSFFNSGVSEPYEFGGITAPPVSYPSSVPMPDSPAPVAPPAAPTATPFFNPGMPSGGANLPQMASQDGTPEQWDKAAQLYSEEVYLAMVKAQEGDGTILGNLMQAPFPPEIKQQAIAIARARLDGISRLPESVVPQLPPEPQPPPPPLPPPNIQYRDEDLYSQGREGIIDTFAGLVKQYASIPAGENEAQIAELNAFMEQYQLTEEEIEQAYKLAGVSEQPPAADNAPNASIIANLTGSQQEGSPAPAAAGKFFAAGGVADSDAFNRPSSVFSRPTSAAQRKATAERKKQIADEIKQSEEAHKQGNAVRSIGLDYTPNAPRQKTEAETIREILTNPDDPFWQTPTGSWGLQNMENFGKVLQSLQAFAGLSGDEKELSWLEKEFAKSQMRRQEQVLQAQLDENAKLRDEERLRQEQSVNPLEFTTDGKTHTLPLNRPALMGKMFDENTGGKMYEEKASDFPAIVSAARASTRAEGLLEILLHLKEKDLDKIDSEQLVNYLRNAGYDDNTIIDLGRQSGVDAENIADIRNDIVNDTSVYLRILYTGLRRANAGFTGIGESKHPRLTLSEQELGLYDTILNFASKSLLGKDTVAAIKAYLVPVRRVRRDLGNEERDTATALGRRAFDVMNMRGGRKAQLDLGRSVFAPSGSSDFYKLSGTGSKNAPTAKLAGGRGKKGNPDAGKTAEDILSELTGDG